MEGVMRKGKVGGPRKGSGRPPGRGPGPSPDARRHRVTVLLSDAELAILRDLAEERDLPLGTAAYDLLAGCLKRRK